MEQNNHTNYNANEIQVLEGLEAVKRRPGVIDGQEGIGQGRPEKIHPAVVHHLRLDFPENQVEDGVSSDEADSHNKRRHSRGHQQQLLGGDVGPLVVLPPQVLGRHDRPAGGQGGKDVDEQDVDSVHQGHAGHGRLPGAGHHDGVGHANGDRQELLHNQG